MARKTYSIQRLSSTGEWRTLLDFERIPRGEAQGAFRMADSHYGNARYRIVEHGPSGDIRVVKEGAGRAEPKANTNDDSPDALRATEEGA